jgi:Holliday junction resolvase RusA-like endonuclease
VSVQTKRAQSREAWKARVKDASNSALPEQHLASEERLSVTLFYFPDAEMEGDVDNIVKYTLDGMSRHVYMDDRQVERVVVQKFEPDRIVPFLAPTLKLIEALESERPVLFIRVSNDPQGEVQ